MTYICNGNFYNRN